MYEGWADITQAKRRFADRGLTVMSAKVCCEVAVTSIFRIDNRLWTSVRGEGRQDDL